MNAWRIAIIATTLLNCAVIVRSIYLLRQIQKYKESLKQLLTRIERVAKEPHP